MKKAVLVNPAAPIGGYKDCYFGEKRPPLGIAFLAAILMKDDWEVDIIDRYLNPTKSFNPERYDFIGISINTPCLQDAVNLIKDIHHPNLAIGGPHLALYPDFFPKGVRIVVVGEGEEVISQIANGSLNGIVKAVRIKDLDELPYIPYNKFIHNSYDKTMPFGLSNVLSINSSRGCPFRCSFCVVKYLFPGTPRFMSAERIYEELKFYQKEYGIDGIYFREDNFFISKRRVRKFCDLILQDNNPIRWVAEMRVDAADLEMLKLIKCAGCIGLYVGFESGSQRMLDIYKKDITVVQSEEFADWCHQIDLSFAASFIEFHPDETKEDRILSNQLINKIKARYVWMNRWREWSLPNE